MKHAGLIALLAAALLAACEEKKPYQPPVPRTELDKAKAEKSLESAGRDREEAAGKAGR